MNPINGRRSGEMNGPLQADQMMDMPEQSAAVTAPARFSRSEKMRTDRRHETRQTFRISRKLVKVNQYIYGTTGAQLERPLPFLCRSRALNAAGFERNRQRSLRSPGVRGKSQTDVEDVEVGVQ